ncbi:MCE family protein [Haloechinothrix sp. LS1_15]|uniref:MCE family protein n=1 Tax=Haloechinothrix sp. LS1_15 TaxID=2652248 RepID=UPI002948A328|nr:MCE family protein [Haloechinothrix sp. LS1_15]MDV6014321.1 MCE family protein [Haloechinothrix sp. LS1_15]
MRTRSGAVPGILGAVLSLLLVGCASMPSVYDMPLPGGADLGDDPYRVTAHFDDVLDLVPHAGVRVDDVPVGRVERIELAGDGTSAEVAMSVNGDVRLPENAVAELRQSSLLGEKFVELARPTLRRAEGTLVDGAVIPNERTGRNTEVEEVLGATSMLLNGGGLGQLQRITTELNAAFEGRSPQLRQLLGELEEFVAGLDDQRDEIVRAIDATDELAETLSGRTAQVERILTELEPGIDVLAEQSDEITAMFRSLDSLSEVAVDTVDRAKDDLVASLRALEPVLRQLDEEGHRLPQAMEVLLTFPFSDAALDAVRGDYINGFLRLDARTADDPPLPLPGVDVAGAGEGGRG